MTRRTSIGRWRMMAGAPRATKTSKKSGPTQKYAERPVSSGRTRFLIIPPALPTRKPRARYCSWTRAKPRARVHFEMNMARAVNQATRKYAAKSGYRGPVSRVGPDHVSVASLTISRVVREIAANINAIEKFRHVIHLLR